jgi:hypothetical protein
MVALGAVDDAQQRADSPGDTDLEPRIDVLPCPVVHSDFAALAAFAVAHEDAAAGGVQVAFGETECFADA